MIHRTSLPEKPNIYQICIFPEMLFMSVLSAEVQHAEIIEIKKPELPEGYFIITGS